MKKLLKNVAAVGAADAGARLIGFITTAYLGRVLGSEGFGLLGMGLAIAGYLFLIASPGIHITGTRDIAARRGDQDALVSTVLAIRMVLAPALVVLTAVGVLLWQSDWTMAATLIVAAAAIIPMAFSFDWYFQGKEQFVLLSSQKLINALAFLVAALLLVKGPGDAALAAAAFVTGTAGASVFSYLAYRRQGRFVFSWNPPFWRQTLEGSYPLALSSLLGQTATAFPILVAGTMLSTHDAGQMNAATKLILLALIMDRVFATLFLPALSRATEESRQTRIVQLGLKIMLLVAAPIAVVGWVLAPLLMTLVFGEGFVAAVAPFRILLVYLVTTLVNSVFVAAFIVARRERLYFNIMLTGSLVTAAVALSATPLVGIPGTAAAVSVGEALMTALFAYILRASVFRQNGKDFLPLLAAAFGMAALAGVLSMFSMPLAVVGGLALYAIVLFLMKGVTPEDLQLLREVAG
jgi:O-antigen/teichoic acid export membrane protein